MFTVEKICSNKFYEIFLSFLNEEEVLEDIRSILIDYKFQCDKDCEKISSEELFQLICDFYKQDNPKLFEIIRLIIKASDGFGDYFESVTNYNYYWLDWKSENPNGTYDDFSNESYNYLSDVDVFVFRTKNKLGFIHNGHDDYKSLDIIDINTSDCKSQIEARIAKIEKDEFG